MQPGSQYSHMKIQPILWPAQGLVSTVRAGHNLCFYQASCLASGWAFNQSQELCLELALALASYTDLSSGLALSHSICPQHCSVKGLRTKSWAETKGSDSFQLLHLEQTGELGSQMSSRHQWKSKGYRFTLLPPRQANTCSDVTCFL